MQKASSPVGLFNGEHRNGNQGWKNFLICKKLRTLVVLCVLTCESLLSFFLFHTLAQHFFCFSFLIGYFTYFHFKYYPPFQFPLYKPPIPPFPLILWGCSATHPLLPQCHDIYLCWVIEHPQNQGVPFPLM